MTFKIAEGRIWILRGSPVSLAVLLTSTAYRSHLLQNSVYYLLGLDVNLQPEQVLGVCKWLNFTAYGPGSWTI